MATVNWKVTGVREMIANLRAVASKAPKALERAVYRFGQIEMAESKRRVPVDTGTLKNSGFVEKPVRISGVITLELGYGGAAEDYAIPVHEDLEAFHKTGQAKYLESVLNESAPYFAQRVAADFAADMGMNG